MSFSFASWVRALMKGMGHRYIKRIPYMTPKGRRYRYIYRVDHTHQGKHAFHEDHIIQGTKFALSTEDGAEFHGHIESVDGDKVKYMIDDGPQKGAVVETTKQELAAKLNEVHGVSDKLADARDKASADLEQVKQSGGSEKQIARARRRLLALGGTEVADQPEPTTPEPKKTEGALDKEAIREDLVRDLRDEDRDGDPFLFRTYGKERRLGALRAYKQNKKLGPQQKKHLKTVADNLNRRLEAVISSDSPLPLSDEKMIERYESFAEHHEIALPSTISRGYESSEDTRMRYAEHLREVKERITEHLLRNMDIRADTTRGDINGQLADLVAESLATKPQRDREKEEARIAKREQEERKREIDALRNKVRRASARGHPVSFDAADEVNSQADFERVMREAEERAEAEKRERKAREDERFIATEERDSLVETSEESIDRYLESSGGSLSDHRDFLEESGGVRPADIIRAVKETEISTEQGTPMFLTLPDGNKVALLLENENNVVYQYSFSSGNISEPQRIKVKKFSESIARKMLRGLARSVYGGEGEDGTKLFFEPETERHIETAARELSNANAVSVQRERLEKFESLTKAPITQDSSGDPVAPDYSPIASLEDIDKDTKRALKEYVSSNKDTPDVMNPAVVDGQMVATNGRLVFHRDNVSMSVPDGIHFTLNGEPPEFRNSRVRRTPQILAERTAGQEHAGTLSRDTVKALHRALGTLKEKDGLTTYTTLKADGENLVLSHMGRELVKLPQAAGSEIRGTYSFSGSDFRRVLGAGGDISIHAAPLNSFDDRRKTVGFHTRLGKIELMQPKILSIAGDD